MAAFDTSRSSFVLVDTTGRITGHIGALIGAAFATAQAWLDSRSTYKTLSKLDDRTLDDIGLSRVDIDRMAGL
ncbi:MAG: DUF1127 domain-containing protein [Paracoccaceae bacterium]